VSGPFLVLQHPYDTQRESGATFPRRALKCIRREAMELRVPTGVMCPFAAHKAAHFKNFHLIYQEGNDPDHLELESAPPLLLKL